MGRARIAYGACGSHRPHKGHYTTHRSAYNYWKTRVYCPGIRKDGIRRKDHRKGRPGL